MDLPKRGMAVRVCAAGNAVCAASLRGRLRPVIRRPGWRAAKADGAPAWSSFGLSAPSTRQIDERVLLGPRAATLAAGQPEHRTGRQARARDPRRPLPARRRPGTRPLLPGQIADVAVYKNTAYLNSWAESTCKRGGFFSVDISDPANPKQLAFVPALPGTYHGEGAHVDHAQHPGRLPGRRPGGQQRAVRRPTASAASTSTTSATRPTRRSLDAGRSATGRPTTRTAIRSRR